MNTQEYISEVLAIYHSRNKILRYTELRALFDVMPSTFFGESQLFTTYDPLFSYTKSAKSYNIHNKAISGYTNPQRFTPRTSINGVGFDSSINIRYTCNPIEEKPRFKGDIHNYLALILTLPFVKNMYIVGSHALSIQQANSDIDIMVEVDEHKALFMRYCIKIILKLYKLDVHNIWWNFNTDKKQLLNNQIQLKRTGAKIDVGIVTTHLDNFNTLYIENIPKQIWLKRKKKVCFESELKNKLTNQPMYVLYPTPSILNHVFNCISYLLVWVLFPFNKIITSIERQRLSTKAGIGTNYIANPECVSFIPRIHSYQYFSIK